jgi:quercetin dioxygenase-like cupin family protein
MGPGPSGPGPHFHRGITESFFVLSGSVRLHDGERWLDGHPGDFLHVPEGGIHGFRHESGEPASMLLLFTPGAPREDYFETLVDAARRAVTDEADWAAYFLRHDTFWV